MFGWLVGRGGGSETTQEEEEANAQLTLARVSVSQQITGCRSGVKAARALNLMKKANKEKRKNQKAGEHGHTTG